jgi:leucyl aminopeptidase (aminopeptidase T)
MDIQKGARIVIADCLGGKPEETLLVVTDPPERAIGEALYREAIELGLSAHMIIMPATGRSGAEPTAIVANAMKNADIVVCPTKFSLTHTSARKAACEEGARIATMPEITEEMFSHGAITADYREVAALSDRLTAVLTAGEMVRIEKEGRVLELSIRGRKGVSSNGLYHSKGSSGNLPTGEAYIAPLEGTAEGVVLIDGSLAEFGLVSGPLEIRIEKGLAVEFNGPEAHWLEERLGPGPASRNLGELGLGTNKKARLIGNLLEDEKVYGTAHVAFGSNATFGGAVSAGVHIDGIILGAVVSVDGQVVVRDGEILI